MESIDKFTLIAGDDIRWNDMITIRQPTLMDIRSVGYHKYQAYLSVLLIQKQNILDMMSVDDPQLRHALDLYMILGADDDIRSMFIEALSFFIREPVSFDNGSFYIGCIPATSRILDPVKSIICEISYIKQDTPPEEPKFASKRAREIWLKTQKGKRELEKAKAKNKKGDDSMELPNLISAVAAEHPGYNLTNIWNLTVYQLYDQFARINTRVQIDVYGQRWAAWGQDDFDTTMWFKNYSRKE